MFVFGALALACSLLGQPAPTINNPTSTTEVLNHSQSVSSASYSKTKIDSLQAPAKKDDANKKSSNNSKVLEIVLPIVIVVVAGISIIGLIFFLKQAKKNNIPAFVEGKSVSYRAYNNNKSKRFNPIRWIKDKFHR